MNFANWKTTVLGILLGTAYTVTNTVDWKHLIVSVLMAFVGIVSKDFNVTGGTTPNTHNDPVVVSSTAKPS